MSHENHTPKARKIQSRRGPNRPERIVDVLLDPPIAFHRVFKAITGSTVAALFFAQAWYWSKNPAAVKRQGWFYKTQQEWEEETGLTRREQLTARKVCRQKGLLEEKLKRANGHATLHFRVKTDRLYELIQHLASLHDSRELSLHDSRELIDCTDRANYLTETTRDYPLKARGGRFKTWQETPEIYHPYFQVCTNAPVALPAPVSGKEIDAWLKTFDEWRQKGFTPAQVKAAARKARQRDKTISRPASLTWLLADGHSRANGHQTKAEGSAETVLAKLAKSQGSVRNGNDG